MHMINMICFLYKLYNYIYIYINIDIDIDIDIYESTTFQRI